MIFLAVMFLLNFLKLYNCLQNYTVTVTALYYVDQYARLLLVTGPVPRRTQEIITNDLIGAYDVDVPIRIKPVYEYPEHVPVEKDVFNAIKNKYSNVHAASTTKADGYMILNDMREFLTNHISNKIKVEKPRSSILNQLLGVQGKVSKSNKHKGSGAQHIVAEMKDQGLTSTPYSFFPNTIYYAVEENKCQPEDDCVPKTSSITSSWSTFFCKLFRLLPLQFP